MNITEIYHMEEHTTCNSQRDLQRQYHVVEDYRSDKEKTKHQPMPSEIQVLMGNTELMAKYSLGGMESIQ